MVEYIVDLDNSRKLTVEYRDISKNRLIIFLPGISGNATSERFKYLEKIAVDNQYSIVRMNFQFQEYNDRSLSIKDCINDVKIVLEYLKRRDINTAEEMIIIAKSFGCIIYHLLDIDVSKGILLSPFLKIEDKRVDYINTKLSDLKIYDTYTDIKLLKNTPNLIFHGIKDTNIDVSNSEHITKINSKYLLVKVNSDHSLNEEETHKSIIKKSNKFIQTGDI
jgi:hypothetical protein